MTSPFRRHMLLTSMGVGAGSLLLLASSSHAQTMPASSPAVAQPEAAAPPSGQQLVDALHSAFGGDHHVRAVHAKGVMAVGTFTPSAGAASIVRSPLFAGKPASVLVRFSDFPGIPDIPDNVGGASPRGLAIRFTMADGNTTDIVTIAFNGFPTATAGEFRTMFLAIGASGPTAAKPTPLDAFLASHPIAKTFLTTQKPAPLSYATLSYFGVNAFRFTDSHGHSEFVRYRFIPIGGEAFVPADELPARSPDYLADELPRRLATGAIGFEWYAQVAGPGDVIEDPSVAWPESRRLVHLGTIRVSGMVTDGAARDRSTMFMPTNLPAGIEPADPMLTARRDAYPISFKSRQ